MEYTITIEEVEAQPLAAARGHGNSDNFVQELMSLLGAAWDFLNANTEVEHVGLNVFSYHDDDSDVNLFRSPDGMPLEAGVKVKAPFEGSGKVMCSATPGGTVATTAHFGAYDQLPVAHRAVRTWCKENDRAVAERTTDGLVKVITTKKGVVVGAGIVGPHAGELIQSWILPVARAMNIKRVAGLIAPYPTLGESSKRAAGAYFTPSLFGDRVKMIVRLLARLG